MQLQICTNADLAIYGQVCGSNINLARDAVKCTARKTVFSNVHQMVGTELFCTWANLLCGTFITCNIRSANTRQKKAHQRHIMN